MPAAASSAAPSWRWVVDGGWTTIVWMLPSDAVRSGIRSASTNARAAGAPPASSTASIPPPEGRRRVGDGVVGVRRAASGTGRARPPARFPGTPRGAPRSPRGAPCARERRDAAQDQERGERRQRAARVDVERPDGGDPLRRCPTTTPASTSEWPDRYLVADSTTRSAPSASGRQSAGEANVLSTTTAAPWRWPTLGERRQVGDGDRRVGDRLEVEDPGRRGREGRLDGREVGRVDEDGLHAEPGEDAR